MQFCTKNYNLLQITNSVHTNVTIFLSQNKYKNYYLNNSQFKAKHINDNMT